MKVNNDATIRARSLIYQIILEFWITKLQKHVYKKYIIFFKVISNKLSIQGYHN